MEFIDMLLAGALFGGGSGGGDGGGGKTAYLLSAGDTDESWKAKYPAHPISDVLGAYLVQLTSEPATVEALDRVIFMCPVSNTPFPNGAMLGYIMAAADGDIYTDPDSAVTVVHKNENMIMVSFPYDNPMGISAGVYLNLDASAFACSDPNTDAFSEVFVAWGV